uniref:Putative NUZM NADH-ubiquinone oxidoreductase n=1 Tax=Moniliophthora roreri TaxID=221103 RepID=A0A0W0F5I8_MONRR
MASKKAAESTLYHLAPKGFWKKFRDAVVVNPEISSGLPLQGSFSASDPAQNPYWKRDVRRVYPQLSVVTQAGLSQLLIEHSGQASVAAPQEEGKGIAQRPEPVDLTQAISTITASTKVYTESQLPPSLPTPHKRWIPERSLDAPHDPHSYFPMTLWK